METSNILISVCSDASRAAARARVLSRNGYSVITVQTIDDGVSFCSMLDLQAVIIDEAFCAEAGDPALTAFIGVPVLQLQHAMRPEELVAGIRACVRLPISGGPRLISLTSGADRYDNTR